MSLLLASIAQGTVSLTAGASRAFEFVAPATATLQFNTDGTITGLTDGDPKWYNTAPVASVGDNYELKASMVSGIPVSGTLNTWLPLTSNVAFYQVQNVAGSRSSDVKIEIRFAGGNIMATQTFEMSAEVYSDA